MDIKLAVLTAGLGCTLAGAAFALPMAMPSADITATPARMICNEYGRCWDRADNPGEAIARGAGCRARARRPQRLSRRPRLRSRPRPASRLGSGPQLWLSPPFG